MDIVIDQTRIGAYDLPDPKGRPVLYGDRLLPCRCAVRGCDARGSFGFGAYLLRFLRSEAADAALLGIWVCAGHEAAYRAFLASQRRIGSLAPFEDPPLQGALL